VPTSVLLAVLTAAGLLALAPALVRRYDATERLAAERALSTARVLSRRRRRRSVPGRHPVNPPRVLLVTLRSATPAPAAAPAPAPARRRRPVAPAPVRRRPALAQRSPSVYRRRRVLAGLLLLNAVELVGVLLVGPGFWVSLAVTGTLLPLYAVHLRNRAIAEHRRRRREARRATWLAARQAEVRHAQERRVAVRREAQRRLVAEREAVRRAIVGLDRSEAVRGQAYSIRYGGPDDSRAAGF
jgi:hypothetical protein